MVFIVSCQAISYSSLCPTSYIFFMASFQEHIQSKQNTHNLNSVEILDDSLKVCIAY